MAVGSRHFGHPAISSLIRVKIYDFALYMDRKQVRGLQTQLAALSTFPRRPADPCPINATAAGNSSLYASQAGEQSRCVQPA